MSYNFKDIPQVRPAEIKTYHSETYDRVSPSKSTFDAKGKTLFITAGGKFPFVVQLLLTTDIAQLPVSDTQSQNPLPKLVSHASSSSSVVNRSSPKQKRRSRKPTRTPKSRPTPPRSLTSHA